MHIIHQEIQAINATESLVGIITYDECPLNPVTDWDLLGTMAVHPKHAHWAHEAIDLDIPMGNNPIEHMKNFIKAKGYKQNEVIAYPITNYTSCFGILEEVEQNPDVEYWLAEQSALWVIDKQERDKRPYWADLLTYIHKGLLSNDLYEIDRYDGLLLDLMDDDTPANGTFDYKSLLADEISEDDINLLSSSSFYNQSVMQNVIDKAIQCDISMTYQVLVCLHDIVVIAKSKS